MSAKQRETGWMLISPFPTVFAVVSSTLVGAIEPLTEELAYRNFPTSTRKIHNPLLHLPKIHPLVVCITPFTSSLVVSGGIRSSTKHTFMGQFVAKYLTGRSEKGFPGTTTNERFYQHTVSYALILQYGIQIGIVRPKSLMELEIFDIYNVFVTPMISEDGLLLGGFETVLWY